MLQRPAHPTLSTDVPPVMARRRRLALLVLVVGIFTMVFVTLSSSRTAALTGRVAVGEANLFTYAPQAGGNDYSKFVHRNAAHTRLPCLLCHRREANLMQPKRPGHTPCAGCHAQEFANPGSSICTICHSNAATTDKPDLKVFPRLASFNMKFDHARHKGADCSTCHKAAGRNQVAFSIPSGFAAHTVCYQCHTSRAQSSGRDISSCGTCHQLGSYRRTPMTAKAFQVNFSHAKHGKSQQLSCSDCHQVKAGFGQGKQVTSPLPANHFASDNALSCMSCHNGKRAFGGDDFKSCQKCHTGPTFRFQ